MKTNLSLDLQKLQILVSFWSNQTIFALAGENEIEKLKIGFAELRKKISSKDLEQKELLNILVSGEGNFDSRLQIIWSKIHLKFQNILVLYPYEELFAYKDRVALITAEITKNLTK